MLICRSVFWLWVGLLSLPLWAEVASIVELTEKSRRSLVTIRQGGRTGGDQGVGSGFVISKDGMIATNLHVIGEGRSISVELPDGTRREATSVHAWDRNKDLAIIKIEVEGLAPLPLGDSDALKDGSGVIALGAPQGLVSSVVQGIVSARRDVPEFPGVLMLQIAMPIEPGNSGGPLIDFDGRVQGLVTLRSMRTATLGFAMPVNVLKVLLEKPNSMPMARWHTIGALDRHLWQPLGARWTQRAGRIKAEGQGAGFGGRSLCLWQEAPAWDSYEVFVRVKLDDERGAAGLAFCSDGAEKHYGFYPTNGALRLTRFDGPDVFSWTILEQLRTPHYHEGEWNDLRVRVERERLTCFLNGEKVIESADVALRGGKAGLCKFRGTEPLFRNFRLGESSALANPDADHERFLREARMLEDNARRLRELALAGHRSGVEKELLAALDKEKEDDIDLIHAALLISKLGDPELEAEPYRRRIQRLAAEFQQIIEGEAGKSSDLQKLERLNEFFFTQNGFHGARFDYENQANSHLNEVLEDREGLPITLCVLYMEIGRQAGLDIVGLSRPGQFAVRYVPPPDSGAPMVIDVFEGGAVIDDPESAELAPATKREIILRMLTNLREFSVRQQKTAEALAYANIIVALDPDEPRGRLSRAWLSAIEKNWEVAKSDARWLAERELPEINAEAVQRLLRMVEERQE
ncbi:MAG: transglutaminase family protein [Verrucomicrobiales bacterium]